MYEGLSPDEDEETKEAVDDIESPGFLLLGTPGYAAEDNMRSVADVDMHFSTGDGGAVLDVSDNDGGTQRAPAPTSIDDGDPCYLAYSDSKSAYDSDSDDKNVVGVQDAVSAGTEDSDDDEDWKEVI